MSAVLEKFMLEHFPTYGATGNLTHARGVEYKQLFNHYPALEPFYGDFEKSFDPMPLLNAMRDNEYVIPVTCVVVYMLFCFFGQKIMANVKPFGLVGALSAWNLFLSLFSFYGAVRTVPHMLHRIASEPFVETVCQPCYIAYGNGAAGLATQLFILSKIPELVDTLFIVLRKKPLIFLHWYHHVTVLLYCWNAYVTESAAGLYFVSMNYTVHAVMYFYYFLQAMRMMPKWFPSWIITLLQISQMIVGTFIVCASFYFHYYGGGNYAPGACNNTPSNLAAGGIIYASYLYLFVEFAVKRFIFGVQEAPRKKKEEKIN
eukprot:CAMPEP_0184966624 /NCGR_PEP_ID=MMETSP1098-20130426/241_1 /TAXON_ID=89044 /ORGANISM="Spumella elongata, Strain CCAP 955/1" /LENGTH=315 /DNA_ID=CAMNT_0027487933 /DNA_START=27 /DNA_END=974 /DNA_ORIENTATION=-